MGLKNKLLVIKMALMWNRILILFFFFFWGGGWEKEKEREEVSDSWAVLVGKEKDVVTLGGFKRKVSSMKRKRNMIKLACGNG